MLSRSENELLTRVEPGTPMGDALRAYWQPLLLSSELPESDGAPLRVRLLGEDLIAFRDTSGRVGLVGDHCPHRGASLFFGRNEEGGLRCVYHGWKFDVSGACVDMPNEPPESNFKDKIHHTAYPTRERGGIVWAYLGQVSPPPDLPELEWNLVPADQVYASKRLQECNWVQALEGGIDSSHSSFLHSRLDPEEYAGSERRGMLFRSRDRHPRFEVVDTAYGVLIGARRDADEDSYYWRITQFLMPYYTIFPPYGVSPTINGHAWVPMDDATTMAWTITWHPTRPLTEAEIDRMARGWGLARPHVGLDMLQPPTSAPGGAWRPLAHRANDYLLDREAQRTQRFCGIPSTALQDAAMQESMGPIYDRTREHLGTSDTAVIQVRRRLLSAARALRDESITPVGAAAPAAYRVRSVGLILDRGSDWVAASHDLLQAVPGHHGDSV